MPGPEEEASQSVGAESVGQKEVKLLGEILAALQELVGLETANATLLADAAARLDSIDATLTEFFQAWQQANTVPPGPVKAVLAIAVGDQMGTSLTIDQSGNAVLGFVDDHGDPTAPPTGDGSGLVVSFASDTPGVATVGGSSSLGTDPDGNPAYLDPLSPVAVGGFSLSATVANTSGAELFDNDGTTPFEQPTAVACSVTPGQAVGSDLSVSVNP